MPKNIIICCDGTSNRFSHDENTNVVHLYSCLLHNATQVTYYNPGVGTLPPEWITNKYLIKVDKFLGAVLGKSLDTNVMDCYRFLMETYETDDKIFLFGFSRGAYTVRMLCGIIQMFGLLQRGNTNHARYILNEYKHAHKLFKLANRFKTIFSRKVEIHFLGIWDTVVSIGPPWSSDVFFPYSEKLKNVKHIRHAVAIDETRKHYNYFAVHESHDDLKEVFFAGVHCDVGGGYPEEGLSKISLEWMLGEASNLGLKLNSKKVDRYVFGVGSVFQKPDICGKIHNPYEDFKQRVVELIPRTTVSFEERVNGQSNFSRKQTERNWKLRQPRQIPSNSLVHFTVFDKIKASCTQGLYQPKNVDTTQNYQIEHNQKIVFLP